MRVIKQLPSREEILKRYDYDNDCGVLISKDPRFKRKIISLKNENKDKYLKIYLVIDGKRHAFLVHRIIYFLETGEQPEQIDHIDRNRTNNHISNLREATHQQNIFNSSPINGAASKYKGVYRKGKKWGASIARGEEKYRIGCFDFEEDAAIAYDIWAVKLFEEYCFLNLPNINESERERVMLLMDAIPKRTERTSKYNGVSRRKNGSWISTYKTKNIGTFLNEKDAALAYDVHIARLGYLSKLNFPDIDHKEKEDRVEFLKFLTENKKASKYKGVSRSQKKWRTTVNREYVGVYDTEVEAAKAYNEKVIELYGEEAILNKFEESN